MADDKELKTTSALWFNRKDGTEWEAWAFKMLAEAAKKGCKFVHLSDLSVAVNPNASTAAETANEVSMEDAWATLACLGGPRAPFEEHHS
jgi:hypothetical protein